jgi:DNA polymerase
MVSAADFIPEEFNLATLRSAAAVCQGCELYRRATQTVFGEGAETASLVLVGEVPGDKEDLQGHPFVGPAGALLDRALDQAGIDRGAVYVTNAVKHFKWEARGKRRLHKKPSEREIAACTPWLLAEITALQPKVVVCMGATAVQAAFGRHLRIADLRGHIIASLLSPRTFVTIHPSAILRLRSRPEWRDDYLREYAQFVADLQRVQDQTGA